MAVLKVPYLKELSADNPAQTASQLIASGVMITIDKINWNDFPLYVDTKVCLGFSNQYLWLHYMVKNENIKAIYSHDQDPVWQDSCVEFFVKQGELYRNFEFNALGVCLSAHGPNRQGRRSLDKESLARILRFPSLSRKYLPDQNLPSNWSLTVAIPLELLGLKEGSRFEANFYKCGDETVVPHYLSWSPILTPSPDFHQPDYFGVVELVG